MLSGCRQADRPAGSKAERDTLARMLWIDRSIHLGRSRQQLHPLFPVSARFQVALGRDLPPPSPPRARRCPCHERGPARPRLPCDVHSRQVEEDKDDPDELSADGAGRKVRREREKVGNDERPCTSSVDQFSSSAASEWREREREATHADAKRRRVGVRQEGGRRYRVYDDGI